MFRKLWPVLGGFTLIVSLASISMDTDEGGFFGSGWPAVVLFCALPGAVIGAFVVLLWNRRTTSGKSSESRDRRPTASDPPAEY